MGSNWKNIPLGNLITLQRGHDLPSQDRTEGCVPIMGSSGLTGWHNEVKMTGPGVVVGRSGNSMGVVSYSDSDFWPLNTCLYVTDFKGNDVRYIYYLLQQIDFDQFNSGSAQKSLNRNAVYPFEVYSTEDKDEQRAIAKLLSDFEEKVALNKQINQTLEQMAQTLFKSWFVDFDPVKAKMNGEHPKGMDAATASLFPGKLVGSELGLIPEGWSVESAKSQLDVLRGFSYKGKGLVASLDEGVPMHNLNSVLEGGGYKYKGLKFYSDEFKDKFLVQEGDVLVANTEQGHNHLLIGYGAMIPKHLAFGFCSHHTYRVRPKSDSNVTPEFIERLFGKGRFVKQVQGFTNGTTVNMLPIAGMEMPEFVVPPRTLAKKYSELVKPMKAMIEENHKSNIELAKLRDTLLPKLLSGEIDLESVQVEQVKELAE